MQCQTKKIITRRGDTIENGDRNGNPSDGCNNMMASSKMVHLFYAFSLDDTIREKIKKIKMNSFCRLIGLI